MQCPACHLALRYDMRMGKHDNRFVTYSFSKVKCRKCPLIENCKVGLSKTKTYSITIMSDIHKGQLLFQESDYFKERARKRYMIEAKNSELKQVHGLDRADSVGIVAMRLQSYLTAFVVNIKRIVKLNELKMA